MAEMMFDDEQTWFVKIRELQQSRPQTTFCLVVCEEYLDVMGRTAITPQRLSFSSCDTRSMAWDSCMLCDPLTMGSLSFRNSPLKLSDGQTTFDRQDGGAAAITHYYDLMKCSFEAFCSSNCVSFGWVWDFVRFTLGWLMELLGVQIHHWLHWLWQGHYHASGQRH